MSQDRRYDVVIVGAGIVGASIARELSRYRLRVAVLDKAYDIPSGASRANSSMVHGGFDDKPGTVKASLCAKGNRLYHQLHEELDFQFDPCGSYVCAFNGDEIGHLEMLLEHGRTNGVLGLEIITGDQLRDREPNASKDIVAALWCSSAGMVNNFEAVLAFMDNAQANGVELFLGTEVTGLIKDPSGRSVAGVSSSGGDFLAPVVVNAAGVHSDELSSMAGDDSFTITPVRGEYFIFDKSVGNLVKSFFFPCPTKKGKGITVARTVDGNLLIGPNSVPQSSKEDTSTTGEGLKEVFEGALKLIPSVPRNMSITTFAGLRANSDSGDFHIGPVDSLRGFFNVAGIKSPGLTSAPAIAVRVVEMLKDCYGGLISFEEDPSFVPVRRHIPRFSELPMEERIRLAAEDPRYGQIVCRCETVTEAQVVEAIRRGARTVAAVKIWTRAGAGRCQGGFCGPRVVEILARELGISPEEVTRHGGHSRLLTGPTKAPWLEREGA